MVELLREIDSGRCVYLKDKVLNPAVLENMTLRTIRVSIESRNWAFAYKTEEADGS